MKIKTVLFFTVLLVFICCIGAVSAENATDEVLTSASDDVVVDVDDSTPIESSDDSIFDDSVAAHESNDEPLQEDTPKSKISVNASSWDEIKTYAEKTDGDYIINLVEGKKITIGSSDIQFRNNAEVIGNANCYITGTAANRIPFKSTANTALSITFKNLIFRNIKCQMIMQLQTTGISIVENCTFKSITAGTGHHSLIYNNLGVMNITGCSFTDSSAGFGVVTNHNSGSYTNIILNVRNCYFANNYGSTEPGAINNCGILTVYNSTFENNRAYWWAGAIHTHNFANTTVYDSHFLNNVAGWNGGALYTYSYLRLYNSTFVGNNCTTNSGGGAIGACSNGGSSPDILIDGCLFKDNTNINSGGAGGAMAVMDNGGLQVYNTIFIHNSAAKGTAISASAAEGYGSPTVIIAGNTFINHTRAEEVLRISVSGSGYLAENNTFINNGIPAKELYLNVSEPVDKKVNVTIVYSLSNPISYDANILDKCTYDIFLDGEYYKTINTTTFTLNFEDVDKRRVYVSPSIYSGATPEITIIVPREFIFVSQKNGNDDNDGITNETPVKTIAQAIKLAKSNENILLMDGVFSEENLIVDYRLTIWGTNESSIGGSTLTNPMFNVNNAKFSLRNLTINGLGMSGDSSKLINGLGSRIYLDNCIVKDNVINTLIESPVLGITYTLFENNKISIKAGELTISDSSFNSNDLNNDAGLFNSLNSGDWSIENSQFTNNNLKAGLMSYSSTAGTLKIENSLFENNSGLNQASCIVLGDSSKLNIISSAIKYNDEKIAVIYKTGAGSTIDIKNSIILNAGEIIAGDTSNIDCNYNWWGNTIENKNVRPNLNSQVSLDNWLFLNMEYPQEVEIDANYTVAIDLTSVMTKDGAISSYADYNLPDIEFTVTANNITADASVVSLNNGKALINFFLNDLTDGDLTLSYENITATAIFKFTKTNPQREITANEIMVGDEGIVEITFPSDLTGNVTINVGNITQNKEIKDGAVKFNFEGLAANTYTLTVAYTGDKKYASFEDNVTYVVNKHESTTEISVGKVVVSENVVVTVNVNDDATGNITLLVNGVEHDLTIENGQVSYTIENITRGDWIIEAKYGGDGKYLPSQDYYKFGVDKYTPSVIINLDDIEYGQDAYIEIIMNNDATGNVTVTLENISKATSLVNGKANFTLSKLTAGFKDVKIEYSGDKYYEEEIYSSTFYVDKAPTQVNITATGAKEGRNIIVELSVPNGVDGKFTISVEGIVDIVEIPSDGKVTWTTSDLEVGNHTVYVTYSGDNYLTCKNSTDVIVSPWDEPQWPNAGYDNTGKTPYESDVNGKVNWTASAQDTISSNIVIDSEGNLYIITASGIYSFDKNGNARWKYSSGVNAFSGLSVGRDVIIAPISGDKLYFINQTSGKTYGLTNIWQASSIFVPVIDKNANVYVSGEKNVGTGHYNLVIVPYSVWEEGYDVTLIDLGTSAPTTAPVLVTEDIVCVGTTEGLKLINISSGAVSAVVNVVTDVCPVVGDGDIIYAVANGEIFAIDVAGTQLWKSNSSIKNAKYLAIDNDNGIVYAIDSNNNLYKYDLLNSGNETLLSNQVTSGILIGKDGNIYAGSDSALIALDNSGKLLWKSETGDSIVGAPVMDKNGVIYAIGNNNLFAFVNNNLIDSNLSLPVTNIEYGADAKLIITIAVDATGDIIVSINGTNYTGDIKDGALEIPINNWAIGNYTAIISYSGDKRYDASQITKEFSVIKAEIPISDLNISSGLYGPNPEFSINLPSDATGNFTVSVDGKNYTKELVNGSASISIPKLSVGSHNITVSYSGDNNYNSISNTQTVTVYNIKITNNKDLKMDYNSGSKYKVRVWGTDGKIIAGAEVTFKINKKSFKVKTDKNGYASVVIKEIPKKYTITASYSGVSVKNTVTVKQILKAKNYKVKKSAKKLVLKATLKSSKGKAIKGKVIKFKFKGKTYKAKTNKKGIAKVTIKKKVIKKLKAGKKYALKITYLKDTIKKTVKVKK